MPNSESSLLARKISTGRPKLDVFPALKEFANAAAGSAATAVGGLLHCETQADIAKFAITALSDALTDGVDPGVYYWVMSDDKEKAALVSISPALSVLTTERLLGADLQAPPQDPTPSALNFRMSESLVDVVIASISTLLLEQFESRAAIRPQNKHGMRTLKEAFGDDGGVSVFELSLNLRFEEHEAPAAIKLCFPIEFVERLGLLRRRKPATGAHRNSLWRAQLRSNVLNCELPLPVVLYRYATNVGELSRLKVGQIVNLDPNALQSLDITAMTDAGPTRIASGRLGGYQKNKAVKLTTDVDKNFLRGL